MKVATAAVMTLLSMLSPMGAFIQAILGIYNLEERGLHGPHETLAAQRLVEHLLDSDKTRRATMDVLRGWAMLGHFPESIAVIRPRLDDQEQAELDFYSEE